MSGFPSDNPSPDIASIVFGFGLLGLFAVGLAVDAVWLRRLFAKPRGGWRRPDGADGRPWTSDDALRAIGFLLGFQWLSAVVLTVWPEAAKAADGGRRPVAIMAQIVLFYGGAGLVVWHSIRARGTTLRAGFGMTRAWGRDAVRGLIAYTAALPVVAGGAWLYRAALRAWGVSTDLQDIARFIMAPDQPALVRAVVMVAAVTAAPVVEELLFRGVALPVAVARFGRPAGIALTGILFAAVHFHVASFVPLLLISVAFSLAYLRTGSLSVPIAMHALFNAVSLAVGLMTQGLSAGPFAG